MSSGIQSSKITRRRMITTTGKTLGLFALASLTVACGGTPVPPTATPAKQAAPAAATAKPAATPAPKGPVTLSVWFNFGAAFVDPVNKLQKQFEDSHPNIKIDRQDIGDWDQMRQKTLSAFSAGTGPDVFRIAVFDTAMYAVRKAVITLDDLVDKEPGMGKNVFVEGFLANVMYGGKMWALPWKGSAVTLYWNKKLFRQAGLDPEQPPKTWDEVTEFAKKLTKSDIQQFGFQVLYSESAEGMNFLGPLLYSYQVDLFDSLDPAAVTKAAFNTPKALECLQWLLDMINRHKAVNPPGMTIQDQALNDKSGIWIDGQWFVGTIKANKPTLEYGTTVLPDTKYGVGTTVTGGDHIAISSVCKVVPEAWTFIAWCNTPETEGWFWPVIGGLPGRKEVAKNKDYAEPPYRAFMDQLAKGAKPRPGVPDITEILATIMVEVQLAEFGKQDAATALANAEKKVNAILEKRRQMGG